MLGKRYLPVDGQLWRKNPKVPDGGMIVTGRPRGIVLSLWFRPLGKQPDSMSQITPINQHKESPQSKKKCISQKPTYW